MADKTQTIPVNRLIHDLEQEEKDWKADAGRKALDSIIFYADEKRVEANQREAMRAYGNAEHCRHMIIMLSRS